MIKPLAIITIGASALFLASCATNQNYTATINSWVGANANSLYNVWGYPSRTNKWQNGHKLLVYRFRDRGRYPVTTYPGSTSVVTRNGQTDVYTSSPITTGGGTYNMYCTTWFEINRRNIIVRATSRGNDCAATQRDRKSVV